MTMLDPAGASHSSSDLNQGRFVRVKNPLPGEWQMRIDWSGAAPARYVKRAYSRNPVDTPDNGIFPGFSGHISRNHSTPDQLHSIGRIA